MNDPDAETVPRFRVLLVRFAWKLFILAVVFAAVAGVLGWWAMGMLAGLGNGNGALGE